MDPAFKLGTDLYNPDLDNVASMAAYYNCSALGSPTYNLTEQLEGQARLGGRRPARAAANGACAESIALATAECAWCGWGHQAGLLFKAFMN